MNPISIKVTFKDHFPEHLIEDMCGAEFMGLCKISKRTEDSKVILLLPTPHEYHVLKLQLEELKREGALSFAEVGAP